MRLLALYLQIFMKVNRLDNYLSISITLNVSIILHKLTSLVHFLHNSLTPVKFNGRFKYCVPRKLKNLFITDG